MSRTYTVRLVIVCSLCEATRSFRGGFHDAVNSAAHAAGWHRSGWDGRKPIPRSLNAVSTMTQEYWYKMTGSKRRARQMFQLWLKDLCPDCVPTSRPGQKFNFPFPPKR